MLEKFIVLKSKYTIGDGVFLTLRDENGEPYADVTVNIQPYTSGDIIALSHNFTDFCDEELVNDFIETFTEQYVMSVNSGFVKFNLYKLKENVLDGIEEL